MLAHERMPGPAVAGLASARFLITYLPSADVFQFESRRNPPEMPDLTANPGSGPAAPSRRRWPVWLVAAGVFACGHLVWLLAGLPRTQGRRFYGVAALTLLNLAVAWAFFDAARRVELPRRVRTALKLVALGAGLIGCGATWLAVERYLHPESQEMFSGSDWLFLCCYPVVLAGLAILPRGERAAAGFGRILLDGIVFVVGVGVPLWVFAVQPDVRQASGVDAVLVVVWPVAAFIGVMAVNAALLTKAPLPSRWALWLLLAGLGVSWLADLVFTLDAAARVVIRAPINWINVANTVSVGLLLLAAWRFRVDPLPAPRAVARPAAFSPVPLFTIMVVSGWLVLSTTVQPPPFALDRVVPSMILLFAILFVRETLVMRDSLRSAAAEAQRENRARFEALVRHSSDVILVIDVTGRIRFASPAATVSLGVAPEELVDRPLAELVYPEDTTLAADLLTRLVDGPDPTASARWRLRHRDGDYRDFEAVGSNLLHEPSVGGLVLNMRDVSERVELEERLANAQKMEAVGRMAGGVAHDFNNLLTVILANSELALLDLPAGHTVRGKIGDVIEAAKRGAALTGRLLLLSRRDLHAPDVIAPADLLRAFTPVLQSAAGANLTLQIQLGAGVGKVRVPPAQLEQMFLNLTTNARDASPPGSTLTLSVRNAVLQETLASPYLAAAPGRHVVIEATDTGSGMSEETRARLFEPFFTTKPRGKGMGLGLASIYGTVKAAGGGITVRSEAGRGTAIAIWLPETGPASAAPAPAAAPAPGAGGTETILLVEDEAPVRLATQLALEAKGYRVLPAADADDAERVLGANQGPVHLLLTDVLMPGRSGPALATELLRRHPELRVLFMSGYTGHELEAHGLANAGSRLLVKPFSIDHLTARLRQVLAGPPGLS